MPSISKVNRDGAAQIPALEQLRVQIMMNGTAAQKARISEPADFGNKFHFVMDVFKASGLTAAQKFQASSNMEFAKMIGGLLGTRGNPFAWAAMKMVNGSLPSQRYTPAGQLPDTTAWDGSNKLPAGQKSHPGTFAADVVAYARRELGI